MSKRTPRKKTILDAATTHWHLNTTTPRHMASPYHRGFITGAIWADRNPHRHTTNTPRISALNDYEARRTQIRAAADDERKTQRALIKPDGTIRSSNEIFVAAFITGARWADTHPFPDPLPTTPPPVPYPTHAHTQLGGRTSHGTTSARRRDIVRTNIAGLIALGDAPFTTADRILTYLQGIDTL